MNPNRLKISGFIVFLASLLAWLKGGAQIGFYKTSYGVKRIDEVTELEYEERFDALLPGIETLALGFGIFAVLFLAAAIWESRILKKAKPATN